MSFRIFQSVTSPLSLTPAAPTKIYSIPMDMTVSNPSDDDILVFNGSYWTLKNLDSIGITGPTGATGATGPTGPSAVYSSFDLDDNEIGTAGLNGGESFTPTSQKSVIVIEYDTYVVFKGTIFFQGLDATIDAVNNRFWIRIYPNANASYFPDIAEISGHADMSGNTSVTVGANEVDNVQKWSVTGDRTTIVEPGLFRAEFQLIADQNIIFSDNQLNIQWEITYKKA